MELRVKSFRQYLEEGSFSSLLKAIVKPAAEAVGKTAEKELTKIAEPVSRQAFKQAVPANPDVIYNTLTRAGKDVEKRVLDTYTPEQLRGIATQMGSEYSKLPGHVSGTGWDAWNIGTRVKPGNVSHKNYVSIKGLDSLENLQKFYKGMPDLHARMKQLGDHFNTGFSFKTPNTASGAMTHTDSLVAHHDLPNSSFSRSLDATMRKWAKDTGLEVLERPGMETGVDVSGKSFTELIADKMAKQPAGSKVSLSDVAKQIRDQHTKIK